MLWIRGRRSDTPLKAIILDAGRLGGRPRPVEYGPVCLDVVKGRRLLDRHLEALGDAGLTRVIYAGGYGIGSVRAQYPELTFCRNAEWQTTGVLATLMNAEFHMDDGFTCIYADAVYSPEVIERLAASEHDVALLCDRSAANRRAEGGGDASAEEISVVNGQVVQIGRSIDSDSVRGEYAGLTWFTREGAGFLRDAYHRAKAKFEGQPFRDAAVFSKAHLLDLYQEMIEEGMPLHLVEVDGGCVRVDADGEVLNVEGWEVAQGSSRRRR